MGNRIAFQPTTAPLYTSRTGREDYMASRRDEYVYAAPLTAVVAMYCALSRTDYARDTVMDAVKLNQKRTVGPMRSLRLLPSTRKDIWGIQNEEAVWTSAGIRAWMGLKTECEQMKTKGVWTYGEMAQPRSHFVKERLIHNHWVTGIDRQLMAAVTAERRGGGRHWSYSVPGFD
ncbi:hypothetical protein B0H14DRAFT_2635397 [Mycena olivaceomarginata]|nr:hypothetical protein B0H14DRAFT_2635397 [Mycena olivaceomarginata]